MTDIDGEDAVRLRRVVRRLGRSLNTTATDEGLTQTQTAVLGSVAAHAPVSVSQLLELEHLNPTMLSRVIGQLQQHGLVRRRPHPNDLRAVLFEPTDAGRLLHQRVQAQRAALVLEGIACLTARERRALHAALPALESLAAAVRSTPRLPAVDGNH